MTTAYTLLALYTLAGLLTYPVMHYLMRADLVDDVLDIAVGWREHVQYLGMTLLLWPLFLAMLTTGYVRQRRWKSPEGQAQIRRQIAESKRQQELDVEDALAPWDDYSDYLCKPLTPGEATEIMSGDSLVYRHFRERMRAGDILYRFSTSANTWQHNAGRGALPSCETESPLRMSLL